MTTFLNGRNSKNFSMAATFLRFFLLLLLLLHLYTSASALRTPISAALDVLSDSGYFSMAITLQLTSTALNLANSQTLTIFAPSDLAFAMSGQPSLLDLQYQISPARLPGESLKNLSYDAKIATLRLDTPLIVTGSSGSGGKVWINGVSVQDSAVFDDGYVVIYGTDEFFKPFSRISFSPIPAPEQSLDSNSDSPTGSDPDSPISSIRNSPPGSNPSAPTGSDLNSPIDSSPDSPTASSPNFRVRSGSEFPTDFSSILPNGSSLNFASGSSPNLPNDSSPKSPDRSNPNLPGSLSGFDVDINIFEQASSLLMSRGCTIMGTFLDLQLEGSTNQTGLTLFAPVDEAITEYVTNFSNYSRIFRGHVIQRLLSWKDLLKLGDGTVLHSALKGFMIEMSWSGDILLLNGVPVIFPDMYVSDWIVVHGLNRMIISQSKQDPMGESFSELDGGEEDDHQYSPDFGEYGVP